MGEFPNEIITRILWYTPKRHLVHYLGLNRLWLHLTLAQLYDWIDIYSDAQLKALQRCLSLSAATGSSVGNLIHHIRFHPRSIELTQEDFDRLAELTPNVWTCDYTVYLHKRPTYFTNGWKRLRLLPGWHKDEPDIWVPVLAHQLTGLVIDASHFVDICNHQPVPANIFSCLTTLKIQNCGNMSVNLGMLEAVHHACSRIETLTFNITQLPDESMHLDDIQPAPLVTSLTVPYLEIKNYAGAWFRYLQRKYPRLSMLSITCMNDFCDYHFKTGTMTLYELVTSLSDLESLHIDFGEKYGSDLEAYKMLDYYAICNWLNSEPPQHRLTSFSWLCALPPLGMRLYTSDQHRSMANYETMRRLTSFSQTIFSVDKWLLDYIHATHVVTDPSVSFERLTTLDICGVTFSGFSDPEDYIDLSVLLAVMPNLLNLTLQHFNVAADADFKSKFTGHNGSRLYHPLQMLHICRCATDSPARSPYFLHLTDLVNHCPNLQLFFLHECMLTWVQIVCPLHDFTRISIKGYDVGFDLEDMTLIVGEEAGALDESLDPPSGLIRCRSVNMLDQDECPIYERR
ncbi:hypothetical protein DM01DRAFT_1334579, partial [Hesseltinella vesiculosa]